MSSLSGKHGILWGYHGDILGFFHELTNQMKSMGSGMPFHHWEAPKMATPTKWCPIFQVLPR